MAEDKLNVRPVDFMKHICQLYQDARLPKIPYENIENISRGNSRIVSSEVEDLTAALLSTNLHGEYLFLTDQSMRVENVRRFVPDVVIMKENVIHDIIDVKMDLGRRRDDFYTEGSKWEDILQQINGKDCSFIDGVTKERKYASFADNVRCHIIVISSGNINPEQFRKQISKFDDYESVDVYCFSEDLHPNTYHQTPEEIVEIMNIRSDEFDRLLENIT